MEKQKKSKISYFQSNVTSTVSVALVLVMIGVIAFLAIAAQTITREFKENIGFSIVLNPDATQEQSDLLEKKLKKAPYASRVSYISKEEALRQWQNDTGENLVETFGLNPLSAEFRVNVKSAYSDLPHLKKIESELKKDPSIEEVELYEAEVEAVNRNINGISIVLAAVAALLAFISVALINNTVRLTVYSRRFLIHTMKLVGARPGFIRRPIVVQNALNGVVAAILACILFVCLYLATLNFDRSLAETFTAAEIACVFAGLLAVGAGICALTAFFAANKYIHMDYDDLFKR